MKSIVSGVLRRKSAAVHRDRRAGALRTQFIELSRMSLWVLNAVLTMRAVVARREPIRSKGCGGVDAVKKLDRRGLRTGWEPQSSDGRQRPAEVLIGSDEFGEDWVE